MTHVVTTETDRQISRQDHVSDVAVCARGWRSDKCDIRCRFKKHASVLSLADGIFVYQHHDLALVKFALRSGSL